MLAEAAPPSKIRQLYTKHSTSSWLMELAAIWELTRHGELTAKPGNVAQMMNWRFDPSWLTSHSAGLSHPHVHDRSIPASGPEINVDRI
jgi:hypothetical protein